jgi:mRNA-degrading endonuclease RelE of RelBE toxin-antitoxin system
LREENKGVFKRVRNALMSLSEDPAQGSPLRLSLRGKSFFKVGVYRIIYSGKTDQLTVYLLHPGYKK